MKNILDRIFDSLPLTMAFVVVASTALMSLIILVFNRGKGPQLRSDMFAPGDGQTEAGRASRRRLPQWAGAAAFLLISAGVSGLIASFNGIGVSRAACAALGLAGFVLMFGYDFAMNGAINRLNYFKVALKYFSLAPLLKGGQLLFAAAHGAPPAYALAGLALLYLAWLCYYYGDRFYQNLEAVELGRSFGFEPAKSGLFAGDWIYDSAGEMNGVQALFNIDSIYHPGGRYAPGRYTYELSVLCYCANPAGLSLRVRAGWTGFWSTLRSTLLVFNMPQIERPPQWKGEGRFRANLQALALASVERSGADTSVFSGDFRELWLRGGELKVFFRRINRPWSGPEVKAVLNSATRLAAAFDKA